MIPSLKKRREVYHRIKFNEGRSVSHQGKRELFYIEKLSSSQLTELIDAARNYNPKCPRNLEVAVAIAGKDKKFRESFMANRIQAMKEADLTPTSMEESLLALIPDSELSRWIARSGKSRRFPLSNIALSFSALTILLFFALHTFWQGGVSAGHSYVVPPPERTFGSSIPFSVRVMRFPKKI